MIRKPYEYDHKEYDGTLFIPAIGWFFTEANRDSDGYNFAQLAGRSNQLRAFWDYQGMWINGDHERFSQMALDVSGSERGDVVLGNKNDSWFDGLGGNDFFWGGDGVDYFDGGEGFDVVSYQGAAQVIVDLQKGMALVLEADEVISGPHIEGEIILEGAVVEEQLISVEGVVGTNGNDMFFGTEGPNQIWAMGGDDYIVGRGGADEIYCGQGDDVAVGETGMDYIYGDAGDDKLFGGAGHDWLIGDVGDDYLDGGDGHDTLRGGFGADTLDGGEGDDVLEDRWGGNTFIFGEGADHVIAGGNDDRFVFRGGTGNSTIEGFSRDAGDRIVLDGVSFAHTHYGTVTPTNDAELGLLDTNGNGFFDGGDESVTTYTIDGRTDLLIETLIGSLTIEDVFAVGINLDAFDFA
ncbi:calcium-binding protein [Mesobacterium sp. TK19101]|uniref:Calcium-binding protein n=1 Tax=Mesobacterium hydrothermale TaxID=3111907 RepID=A0ABU6HGT6_9RHOB|nr:calcium-binding protein [Mesobacterium sp. TK19101]MEC3861055.1 calcium-binding protein [Mesobacterium sp. TK19101]